jgi:hypothetical protein
MGMTKRMLLAFGLLFCLALVALVGVSRLRPPKPGVTPENFRRLYKGVSEPEAEAVLGGPGKVAGHMTFQHGTAWEGEHCRVCIWFSELRPGWSAETGTLKTDDGQTIDLPSQPSLGDQARRLVPW